MDYELRRVTRTGRFSPNVIAVVNAPTLQIPTRLYIFEEGLEKTFESIEKAANYGLDIMARIVGREFFQIGFLFGNNYPDKDIFVFPIVNSLGNSEKPRSIDFHMKNGEIQTGKTRHKLDEFPGILFDEQRSLRTHGPQYHIANFPDLTVSGLKYLLT